MKKQLFLFVLFVFLVGCVLLTACGGTPSTTTPPTTTAPSTTAPVTTAPVATAPVTTPPPVTTAPPVTTVTPVFEGEEVTYNGSAHSIAVTGLPTGSTVLYSVNGGSYVSEVSLTDAGEYSVYAYVTVPAGYTPVGLLSATLKINKAPMPEEYKGYFEDSTVAYTGEFQKPVPAATLPAGVSFRVEGAAAIRNAGDTAKYTIVYTYADATMNKNYENRLEDVDLTVTKGDVDMSGVSFDDATLPYTAAFQTLKLTGELPSFLNVSYEGGGVERGEHTITATFTFKTAGDADNYNLPAPMTATLTIGAGEFDLSSYDFDDRTKPWTGSDNKPVFAQVEGLTINVTLKKNGEPVDVAIEPGEYEVTVSFVVDPSLYIKPEDRTFTLTVEDKPLIELEVVDLSGVNFVWTYTEAFDVDGTEKTVVLSDETLEALAALGVTVKRYEDNVKVATGDYTATVYLACDANSKFNPGDDVRTLAWSIKRAEGDSWTNGTIINPK